MPWPFRKPHEHEPFRRVDCLREELEYSLRRQAGRPDRESIVKGQVEGLAVTGPAPITPGSLSGPIGYRGGFLAGHLMATLMATGQPLPPAVLLFTFRYGQALVDPQVEPMLVAPTADEVVKVDAIAWRHALKKSVVMHPNVHRATFCWLQDGVGVAISPEHMARVEARWRAKDGNERSPEPGKAGGLLAVELRAVGVVVRARRADGSQRGDASVAIALGASAPVWKRACQNRSDSSDPLADRTITGLLEVKVDDTVVLRHTHVAIFRVACVLARSRADGFPDHGSCLLDDSSGTWALRLVSKPDLSLVELSGSPGTAATAPTRLVAELIDASLRRFVVEASEHVPEFTDWQGLDVLSRYASD
jgi:hypothetical protein